MIVSHIVAASTNNIIGRDNDLPWDIPEDMKFFRETTKGHIVIMGRKTYESMGKPLPKRLNIIITRQKDYKVDGAIVVGSIDEALEESKKHLADWPEEVFILGGGEIYKQCLDKTDKIYLTRVHAQIEGHASYPEFDTNTFKETSRRDCEGDPSYSFLVFEKN